MNKINYKKLYEDLKEQYDVLNEDFERTNQELYYIKSSRSYKIVEIIRKIIKPLRKLKIFFDKEHYAKHKIEKFINNGDKIAIIPCSFEFDEFVNQRPINYARYLADNGYKVLYIAWQWDVDNKISNNFKIVYDNILQIALYDFIKFKITYNRNIEKIFYINFPHDIFEELIFDLRYQGFKIHYDIMDEWEEFQKVGQASWYNKEIEKKIIMEADYVSAVSVALIEKFTNLRSDIQLSPNGYYKQVTGYENKNIALKRIKEDKINIGYFGHLTSSWFDWEMLFEVARNNSNFHFHIIGYDLSDYNQKKIENSSNITYYGKISTKELANYVKDWNIGIIPFKQSSLAKAVDPIKIYEYLYMGLPVIVSGIEHLSSYPKTIVVHDVKEFVSAVYKITESKAKNNIDKFLEEATWEKRFSKFLEEYKKEGINGFYEE